MNIRARRLQKLVVLFLFGIIVFNYPLLSIFNREIFWGGIPLLYFYVFAVWFIVIALLILVVEHKNLIRVPKNIEESGE
ncbi:MAG: hypothetical protein H6696_15265 [Deferribacteres bacterium]|nr:hypothetical protein [candidate division KSB1 bacterium]MCB9503287.1 hypothetical protein [Deferribacteres bacterium]